MASAVVNQVAVLGRAQVAAPGSELNSLKAGRQQRRSCVKAAGRFTAVRCDARKNVERETREAAPLVQVAQRAGQALTVAAAAASLALSSLPLDALAAQNYPAANQAISDLAILIGGNPQKDASALLRTALPFENPAIREIQAELESIPDNLRGAGLGLGAVDRSVRRSLALIKAKRPVILASVVSDKAVVEKELGDLEDELQKLFPLIEAKGKEAVATQNRKALDIVGDIEAKLVKGMPFQVPKQYADLPQLQGRATLKMDVKLNGNSETPRTTLTIVVDGYNAPITAGNFVDLVNKKFYDGMEIQRADGFVVQTGKPETGGEGYKDPATGKERTIPLELFIQGDKEPIYGDTLEELGRYKAQPRLPFNAFGTIAMAREEFENDSASSQFFFLLKESELTPSGANILDGRYAVFGYVVDNADVLAQVKVGDVIEKFQVLSGIENLKVAKTASSPAPPAPVAEEEPPSALSLMGLE